MLQANLTPDNATVFAGKKYVQWKDLWEKYRSSPPLEQLLEVHGETVFIHAFGFFSPHLAALLAQQKKGEELLTKTEVAAVQESVAALRRSVQELLAAEPPDDSEFSCKDAFWAKIDYCAEPHDKDDYNYQQNCLADQIIEGDAEGALGTVVYRGCPLDRRFLAKKLTALLKGEKAEDIEKFARIYAALPPKQKALIKRDDIASAQKKLILKGKKGLYDIFLSAFGKKIPVLAPAKEFESELIQRLEVFQVEEAATIFFGALHASEELGKALSGTLAIYIKKYTKASYSLEAVKLAALQDGEIAQKIYAEVAGQDPDETFYDPLEMTNKKIVNLSDKDPLTIRETAALHGALCTDRDTYGSNAETPYGFGRARLDNLLDGWFKRVVMQFHSKPEAPVDDDYYINLEEDLEAIKSIAKAEGGRHFIMMAMRLQEARRIAAMEKHEKFRRLPNGQKNPKFLHVCDIYAKIADVKKENLFKAAPR